MNDYGILILSAIGTAVLAGGLYAIAAIDQGIDIVTNREIIIGIIYSIIFIFVFFKVADRFV